MIYVDMGAIRSKADNVVKSSSFQREKQNLIKAALSGSIKIGMGGISIPSATEAAQAFIQVLTNHISSSGISANAASAISNLSYGSPNFSGETCNITVSFSGTARPSLVPERYPGGISHLEELFDKGVGHTMRAVHGTWNGNDTWSRTTIPGAHFIDAAVSDFLASYGATYNVVGIEVTYEY